MTMSRMQLNSKFVNNMLPEWSRFITEVKLNRGSSSTENLIESLSNTLALLTQSYKSHLPQTNNQLRASSNARSKAMVQDGKVVVQDGNKFTNVDDDVDDSPENDLALNVDHVFEADECDAFDSDVDEGPITQTMS
ncbi:hypothetical protein Tco_1283294 [Tanacetum coccineum]